jgi:hypothetical protein
MHCVSTNDPKNKSDFVRDIRDMTTLSYTKTVLREYVIATSRSGCSSVMPIAILVSIYTRILTVIFVNSVNCSSCPLCPLCPLCPFKV